MISSRIAAECRASNFEAFFAFRLSLGKTSKHNFPPQSGRLFDWSLLLFFFAQERLRPHLCIIDDCAPFPVNPGFFFLSREEQPNRSQTTDRNQLSVHETNATATTPRRRFYTSSFRGWGSTERRLVKKPTELRHKTARKMPAKMLSLGALLGAVAASLVVGAEAKTEVILVSGTNEYHHQADMCTAATTIFKRTQKTPWYLGFVFF
jgi:hypothetical protein